MFQAVKLPTIALTVENTVKHIALSSRSWTADLRSSKASSCSFAIVFASSWSSILSYPSSSQAEALASSTNNSASATPLAV